MSGQVRSVIGLCLAVGVAVAAFLVPARDWRTVVTLRMLAGSELDDLVGPGAGNARFLQEMERATGVRLQVTFTGSLSGAETLATGSGSAQLAWFASDTYVRVLSGGADTAIVEQRPVTRTSVVLGVKRSVATRYGWDRGPVSWGDVAAKVAAKDPVTGRGFSFAMADPASSNSGLAALVGATAAVSGDAGLDSDAVDRVEPALSALFRGVGLTAGSSGWLTDRYVDAASDLDAMINYESEIISLNQRGETERLDVVRPENGVVDVDYPLMLLRGGADQRAAFDRLATWLRQDWAQRWITENTRREPVGAAADDRPDVPLGKAALDQLLVRYQDRLRKPSRTFYVIDKSGSMAGAEDDGGAVSKMDKLKAVFDDLAGGSSAVARFRRFRADERVTVLPFDSALPGQFGPGPPVFRQAASRTVGAGEAGEASRRQLTTFVRGLRPGGGTALFDALYESYLLLRQEIGRRPFEDFALTAYPSIVLLTDGQRENGMSANAFAARWRALGAPKVRVFAVQFGPEPVAEGCGRPGQSELCQVTQLTGGRVFDTSAADLLDVFREIRGYQ